MPQRSSKSSGIVLPQLSFTPWIDVLDLPAARTEIPIRTVGIYIVAVKSGSIGKLAADSLDEDLLYIGMTTSSLRSRLRSLLKGLDGRKGHSGGKRICKLHGRYPESPFWKKRKLYVSYAAPFGQTKFPKTPDDFLRMGTITYLEYKLLGDWYAAYGCVPPGNAARRGETRRDG